MVGKKKGVRSGVVALALPGFLVAGAASQTAGGAERRESVKAPPNDDEVVNGGLDSDRLDSVLAYRRLAGLSTEVDFVRKINADPEAFDALVGSDTLGLFVTPDEYQVLAGTMSVMEGREPILDYLVESKAGARAIAFSDGLQRNATLFTEAEALAAMRSYAEGDDAWRELVGSRLDRLKLNEETRSALEAVGGRDDETWAGMYVDWETGSLVVRFTEDSDFHDQQLKRIFHTPERIRAEPADHTLLEMRLTANMIALDVARLERQLETRLIGVGVDVMANNVRVGLTNWSPEAARSIVSEFGDIVTVYQAQGIGTVNESPSPTWPCNGDSPGTSEDDYSACDPARDLVRRHPRSGLSLRLGPDGLKPTGVGYVSSGFIAENSAGVERLLMAAHSIGDGDPVHQGESAIDDTKYRQVGTEHVQNYGGFSDAASVILTVPGADDIYERASLINLDVNAWDFSVNNDAVGDATCLSGTRNPGDQDAANCGILTQTDFLRNDGNPSPSWKAGFRCSTHLSDPGDSGAGIYRNTPSLGVVRALGIHNGRASSCADYTQSWGSIPADAFYSHISPVITDLSLEKVKT